MALEASFKLGVPGFLKPEVPVVNTLKKMAKNESVTVLRLSNNGKTVRVCDMMKGDKWIFDDLKKIRYMCNHEPIKYITTTADEKPHTTQAYIVDDDTASTIDLQEFTTKTSTLKITAVELDGKEIQIDRKVAVPEIVEGYAFNGSTISLVGDQRNRKWYNPGPSGWDWFMDNKAISDMFPKSMPMGWLAVMFALGAMIFGPSGFIIGGLLFKLLLG